MPVICHKTICQHNKINNSMQNINICGYDNPEISVNGHCKSSKNRDSVKRCPGCNGVGLERSVWKTKEKCKLCGGKGYIKREER